ncbi:MAG: DUF4339 domain-containing protein [Flavobacteriales bacterium]|nr:DUF4339 domain-containing protein [Flavobacteriales bacterium]MBP7156288.1 DUF4339 domain-containing protein [Flavobacteriales bacterium]
MQQQKGKRYFIRRHDRISGPFTKEELCARRIEDGTQVWNEEAFDWHEAYTFDELCVVLEQPPPQPGRKLWNWFRWRTTR